MPSNFDTAQGLLDFAADANNYSEGQISERCLDVWMGVGYALLDISSKMT